jgi:hypothetical protein
MRALKVRRNPVPFERSTQVGEAGVNEGQGVALVASCQADGCVQGKGFEGYRVPGKGFPAEAPRVAWLIPMSHSRSAARVWKRDEPQGRLRDATSPHGDARSKPSKSGGTTRTEGAGGLADPCTAAREAAISPTGELERTQRVGLRKVLWWKPGMKSERTRIIDVDGGASHARSRCARPSAVL